MRGFRGFVCSLPLVREAALCTDPCSGWLCNLVFFFFQSLGDNEVRVFSGPKWSLFGITVLISVKQFKDNRQINKPVVVRSQKIK